MRSQDLIIGEEYAIRWTRHTALYGIYLGPGGRGKAHFARVKYRYGSIANHFGPVAEACAFPATKWESVLYPYNAILKQGTAYRAERAESESQTAKYRAEQRARQHAFVEEHFEGALRLASAQGKPYDWAVASLLDLGDREIEKAITLLAAVGKTLLDLPPASPELRVEAQDLVARRYPQ